jgi:hypothetical protein
LWNKWWNELLAEEIEVLGENLSQCRDMYNKFHIFSRAEIRTAAVGSLGYRTA